ncbi:hypothetical protein YC2023_085645 [Brassica napus]
MMIQVVADLGLVLIRGKIIKHYQNTCLDPDYACPSTCHAEDLLRSEQLLGDTGNLTDPLHRLEAGS